jgi:tripartite-type tricarboxylate transporter receptor subunit TctC
MKIFLAAILCALGWLTGAQAQDFPSRPITMIVPLPAGSAFDVTARIIAERMQASLGQPVVVENVTGAAGSIGTGRVARAAPDGYTLVFGGLITHVINPAVLKLSYDVLADFEAVAPVATTDLLIVARKSMPAEDLHGLLAWLKANPDKASQGSGGPGSLTQLAGILFQKQTGTRFAIVPYRGAGAAVTDLVAGHLDIMLDLAPNSLPHMRAGAIKCYAVMARTRLRTAPEVPTVDEAGLPGLYMATWEAIWAPKGTPMTVINKLNAAVADALATPRVASRLASLGQEIFPREQQSPEALAALHKAEIDKWWPIIKAADVTADAPDSRAH